LFQVIYRVGKNTYKLKLPKDAKIYLIFYISLLEKAPNSIPLCKSMEIKPIEEEYEVECILDMQRTKLGKRYLIK